MSTGFHYYHTVYKSLSLQWFDGRTTPLVLGRVVSISNAATLVALGSFLLLFWGDLVDYPSAYLLAGLATFFGGIYALFGFPKFPEVQEEDVRFVLRWRYLPYYILTFLSGARRQIFIVFATFILVKIFALTIEQMLILLLINAAINMVTGLALGPAINWLGERLVLQFEYLGLVIVFMAYGLCLAFADAPWALPLVIVLYVVDHILFQFYIGIETYFKKIADPEDISGSAAVSFSINHIAAVTLPVLLGLIYVSEAPRSGGETMMSVTGPTMVFWVGAALALASLITTFWMPRHRPDEQS